MDVRSGPLFLAIALIVSTGCRTPAPAPAGPTAPRESPSETAGSGGGPVTADEVNRRGHHALPEAQPGSFDFFLLNLSWDPEYCATHPGAGECAAHRGFVVHGLWPENVDGTYPENCSNAPGPANPSQYLDLQPTVSLVMHEWRTHGTCSGLAADAYFQAVRKAFQEVAIPANLQPGHTPPSLTPGAMLAGFQQANSSFPQGSFAVSCGNNQLTAAEACFSKGLQPESCQNVKSCKANMVKITAP